MPPLTTPTHIESTTACLRLQQSLVAQGWNVEALDRGSDDRFTVALLARRRTSASQRESALFHVFGVENKVKVGDLWSLLGGARKHEADAPVLCLAQDTRMSSRAVELAVRLGVQVVRLSD